MRRSFRRPIFNNRVMTTRTTRVVIAIVAVASLALGIASRIIPQHMTKAAASSHPAAAATYTLITSDRVLVTRMPDGKPTVTVVPNSGGGGSGGGGGGCGAPTTATASPTHGLQTVADGQHLYVIPDVAAGYIGAPLSIDLFDVAAMAPDTATTAAAQPQVSVEYTSAASSSAPLPPGLSKKADSSVVVTDRKLFGATLAQSWQTTASGGASHLFDGIARIARAGAATTAAPTPPPGKLFTLNIKAFDRSGRPAVAAIALLDNVDSLNTYFSAQGFYRGDAAFSVPAGHYELTVGVHTYYPDGSYDAAVMLTPELDVSGDMTIIVEARKANLVSATTPLPAVSDSVTVGSDRITAAGETLEDLIMEFCGVALYMTPTTPVSVGTVSFAAYHHLINPQRDPAGYTYDLYFPYGNVLPPTLTETVSASQLATLDSRYHSPVLGRPEQVGRIAWSPGQASLGIIDTFVAPGERAQQYVTAQPNVFWQEMIEVDGASWSDFVFMQGNLKSFRPGEQAQDDWLAQPMASGLQQETVQDPGLAQVCPLCRSGDTLRTYLFPFTDQHAYVFSIGPATSETLTLYQNGTQVGQLPYGYGATFPLSPNPATYKLVYDVSKNDPTWPTSTGVHTEWTFASQERAPDQLPPGGVCDLNSTVPAGCSFEPLLFAQYSTPTAGLDNVIPAGGPATVEVTVRHQRGTPSAADAPIAKFGAQVSYDDGVTWQDAPATDMGNGVFRLQYTQPALDKTSGFATLHFQAADSNGSAIDQTITRAYPLSATPLAQLPTTANKGAQPACATASVAPYAQCMALVNTDAGISTSQPHGLGPADIQSAYNLSPTAGQGRTVAIVDAFDDPNAESDLAVYRAHYRLPACSSANGCFTKVNQRGDKTTYPMPDPGWSLEISLDLDAVSATCPQCHILLVEADWPTMQDLITAVQTANRLGANVISNSYGSAGEFSGEQVAERAYRDLSVPFVVSSGDYGYGNATNFLPFGGPAFPAASQYAIAVGGTTLTRATTPRGWSESAWGEAVGTIHWGATSGCSAYIHKPGWQKDNLCGMRTVADVAAVADPQTGLAVYDTFYFNGWLQIGGTSLSAPIISAVFAMAGDGSTVRYASNLYSHAGTADLNDVVGGSNASSTQCVNGNYLCTAVPGYDGPTGLGTPNGVNAFH